MTANPIQFELTTPIDKGGNKYQHLLLKTDSRIDPDVLNRISLPEEIDSNLGIIIDNGKPNWLCSYLVRKQASVAWIACLDLRSMKAIVVKTNVANVRIGQQIDPNISREEILGRTERKDKQQQLNVHEPQNLNKYIENTEPKTEIKLQLLEIYGSEGVRYQGIEITAVNISSKNLLNLELPKINFNRGIVFDGSAPIWLYAYLVERYQQAAWVACHNVMSGAIVVDSKSKDPNFAVGASFKLTEKLPCPTIIVGGPPNSGKSVLTYALEQSLKHEGYYNRVHTLKAHWDGHGDWLHSMPRRDLALYFSLVEGGEPKDKKAFFEEQTKLINNLRSNTDLAIVDFGGKPKPSDLILVRRCTHYIVISNSAQEIDDWHNYFGKKGALKPLAVIHSVLEDKLEIISREPYLEIVAGKWEDAITKTVPDILCKEVVKLFT